MPREIVRRYVELDKEDVRWFEEHYPRGAITGILQILLSKFREVSAHTPAYYAEIAAKALAEEHGS